MGKKVASSVCRGEERLYYRFRGTRFYGGISTADVVGCNLRCAFCWSWKATRGIPRTAKFYSPSEVAEKLIRIARERGFELARVSGGEPTLCPTHLLKVIDLVNEAGLTFVLETNGILIGYDKSLAKDLVKRKVFVRVSIKAPTPEAFSRVTGAKKEAFELQIRALKNLIEEGVDPKMVRAAVVLGYGTPQEYADLIKRLEEIHPLLGDVEFEVLTLYPPIMERLKRLGLLPSVYRAPSR
ncbi:radical SAM protein [Ignicoccus hospitalis]|uniref:radical SAM protein n=1 Tax=Ignicoccus hospitalis TaxID=160233 RepID=UPI001EE35D8D|nr:radical SAM protein [Ignicoccus hospitalis]